jgi:hypothetical protein
MSFTRGLLVVALLACSLSAWPQKKREAHIGYAYPGGGQRDTVVTVTIGGQNLRTVDGAYVSGEGVTATFLKHYTPPRFLKKEQRAWLAQYVRGPIRQKTLEAMDMTESMESMSTMGSQAVMMDDATMEQPNHPLTENVANLNYHELRHLTYVLMKNREKRQINNQIHELVTVELSIAPDATPGYREIRLATRVGLTNAIQFQVGTLPERKELEPNGPSWIDPKLPQRRPIPLPTVLNGQMMPGDIDRFRLEAHQGQSLVIEVCARGLTPFLADAVPGWFQATVELYDPKGQEVAYADDYRFNPDPALFYEIPEDGIYELAIHDAIYRGREDFVYRVKVSESPFITGLYPLGGQTGVSQKAELRGWNLNKTSLELNTLHGSEQIREAVLQQDGQYSNKVPYAVDSLPELTEMEPNGTAVKTQALELPAIINGRIDEAGDVDVFEFRGRKGDTIVAEVFGRRLQSPLDSLLRITNASGKVLAMNDDFVDKEGHLHRSVGLLTHHADSYLSYTLPKKGTYHVQLSDAQHQGGPAHGYRLRISPPQPGFSLSVSPSHINFMRGQSTPVVVHAFRRDGFNGPIDIDLVEGPEGFSLSGASILPGQNQVRMTLSAPRRSMEAPVQLRLEGKGRLNGTVVKSPVTPVDDVMQAFLYRHLAPSKALTATVLGRKWQELPLSRAQQDRVLIPETGVARIRYTTRQARVLENLQLEVLEAPEGISIGEVELVNGGLEFLIEADGETAKAGLAENLIVTAYKMVRPRQKEGEAPKPLWRTDLGVLPAIPFKVVSQ